MKSDLTAEELPKYFRANVFAQLLDELDPLFTCNGRRALSDIIVRADGTSVEIEFTLSGQEPSQAGVAASLWMEKELQAISAVNRRLEPIGWIVSGFLKEIVEDGSSGCVGAYALETRPSTDIDGQTIEESGPPSVTARARVYMPGLIVLVVAFTAITAFNQGWFAWHSVLVVMKNGFITVGIIVASVGLSTKNNDLVGIGAIIITIGQFLVPLLLSS
jgi:hypothetical protein